MPILDNTSSDTNNIDAHLNLNALREALFYQAPADFIENAPEEYTTKITTEVHNAYKEFLLNKAPYLVTRIKIKRSGKQKERTAFILVLDDRPFIVDTLTETLRSSELAHSVLLHPIVRQENGRRISLSYVELQNLETENRLEELKHNLESALSDLRLITEDYRPILAKLFELINYLESFNDNEHEEILAYLRWLGDGGFVFLGYREWVLNSTNVLESTVHSSLGLFRSANDGSRAKLVDVEEDVRFLHEKNLSLHHAKLLGESPIHRFARMDLVAVSLPQKGGRPASIAVFVGLFTSKASSQEASSVPVIRRKLKKILEINGLLPHSHDYKEHISIANCLPKSQLLQYDTETLRASLNLVARLQRRAQVRVRASLDSLHRFISVIIVLPRGRFSENVQNHIVDYLEKVFCSRGAVAESQMPVSDLPVVILHVLVPNLSKIEKISTNEELEIEVTKLSRTWDDILEAELSKLEESFPTDSILGHYAEVFPSQYKALCLPAEAVRDIQSLESLSAESPLEFSLSAAESDSGEGIYDLKLYKRGAVLTLSAILPFLENIGFSILHETVTSLITQDKTKAAIYHLLVKPRSKSELAPNKINQILLPGIKLVLNGLIENDRLNQLLIDPGLSYREVAILRTLTQYLWQIKASPSDQAIITALVENPTVAETLVRYFQTKFNPELHQNKTDARSKELESLRERFISEIRIVTQLTHDKILRRLLNVIDATVRTNFYLHSDDIRIALKIDCKKIERMPNPRPFVEIFVSAFDFQGVHLRGGKVARGGIRWSDREDDFRTEVLSLMKTQTVKNSIIIPVGAKGGFVIKDRPANPEELSKAVRECYIRFVRSMLEITDNRVEGKIVHPRNCLVYDGEDPYFVVAADRGTATFSDLANGIATEEFKFWLGDAFASGGSNGYDHKKLGITARGAWQAVCRHFREIGIDPETQKFTVVGIGDMSGDVFGNGMLLSDKIRLVAAFDHRHIFIDPNPDTNTSFTERKRLFQLPRSSWADYQTDLISTGGGIYERKAKEVHLSPEAKQALGIDAAVLSGNELVRAVLRAPVDLLWNGGIGTYVKSAEEDDLAVGDRANDEVRVDARDLRTKVVGEGGNLGLTQLARIEYSKIGGHINTDAIDNSGGVNLSDLEVNIKILLQSPMQRGEISFDERNKLLNELASEVCEKVVSRNRSQSKALSLGVIRSRKSLGYTRGFITTLEQQGLLDRKTEFLPQDETLVRRLQMKAGFTRPELAILIGYAKMWTFNRLMDSNIPDDLSCEAILYQYFPKSLREKFASDICKHPLRREIIATEIANSVIEQMGSSFLFRTEEETGNNFSAIMKSFIVSNSIVDGLGTIRALRILDTVQSSRLHQNVILRLTAIIEGMSRWFLDHPHYQLNIQEIITRFRPLFQQLIRETANSLNPNELARFREFSKQLTNADAPQELADTVAALPYSSVYLDIIETSVLAKVDVIPTAKLFSQLYVLLHVRELLEHTAEVEPADRWEATAIRTLTGDVRRSIAKIALAIIQQNAGSSPEAVDSYLSDRSDILSRFQSTYRELSSRPLTVPGLLVMTNQLFALSRNSF